MTAPVSDDGPDRQERTFYGRRHGRKLRAGMKGLLEERLPELRVAIPDNETSLDPADLFDAGTSLFHLEIGFGGGEHLAAQAAAMPGVGFIGAEPFVNGVASLLRHVEDQALENVRVFPDDVHILLDVLKRESFERIYVLFADPWPKKRHAARRIIQHETIAIFHDLLIPGGELRLATDDMPYHRWMFQRALAHPGLTWLAERSEDWLIRPDDWPATRYEAKAIRQGRAPVYLRFQKT